MDMHLQICVFYLINFGNSNSDIGGVLEVLAFPMALLFSTEALDS